MAAPPIAHAWSAPRPWLARSSADAPGPAASVRADLTAPAPAVLARESGDSDATHSPVPKHVASLDALRGLAVLSVLAFHFGWTFPETGTVLAWTHRVLWSGWIGVDLFFVLSGFLITRGLIASSSLSLGDRMKRFWMRRVLRIFPLYYGALAVGTAVCLALGTQAPSAAYWL